MSETRRQATQITANKIKEASSALDQYKKLQQYAIREADPDLINEYTRCVQEKVKELTLLEKQLNEIEAKLDPKTMTYSEQKALEDRIAEDHARRKK